MNIDIGSKIKLYRILNHYSLRELGELIGKTKTTVYRYENNELEPDLQTILTICSIFQITLYEFLEMNEDTAQNLNAKNPFQADTLYLYYRGFKDKLLVSELNIRQGKNIVEVTMKNAINITKEDVSTFVYKGTLEANEFVTFINLSNYANNAKFEKVQINLSNQATNNDMYLGTITATKSDNNPTIRKCVVCGKNIKSLSKEQVKEIYNMVTISESEIDYIKKYGYFDPELRDISLVAIQIDDDKS